MRNFSVITLCLLKNTFKDAKEVYQLCWGHCVLNRADVHWVHNTNGQGAHINDIDTYQRESFVAIIDTLIYSTW